jgi:hypothetical protein
MAIPTEIQARIDSYLTSLQIRYPVYNAKRIGTGYATGDEALEDGEYSMIVFSDNTNDFTIGDSAYLERDLSNPFDGTSLWYHVFSETGEDVGYAVQIDSVGLILDSYSGASANEIKLSAPGNDNLAACEQGPREDIYYTDDLGFNIGSIIYADVDLTRPFNGNRLYFSIYDMDKNPYGVFVQIDRDGFITQNGLCKG